MTVKNEDEVKRPDDKGEPDVFVFKEDAALDYILASIKVRTALATQLRATMSLNSFLAMRPSVPIDSLVAQAKQCYDEVQEQDSILVLLCEIAERLKKSPPLPKAQTDETPEGG